MPIHLSQHRAVIGNHQNKRYDKNSTHVSSATCSKTPPPPNEILHFLSQLETIPEKPNRQSGQIKTMRRCPLSTVFQLMLLIQVSKVAAFSSDEQLSSAVGNNGFPAGPNYASTISPEGGIIAGGNYYPATAYHSPSLISGAVATQLPREEGGAILKNDNENYIITDEQKKKELISSLVDYFVAGGELSAEDGDEYKIRLQSEAAGEPIVIADVEDKYRNSSRIRRMAERDRERFIEEHIKEHCVVEKEVLNDRGENTGKVFLLWAQRAENPFRIIYDGADGHPSPELRGAADGLNIIANIFTIGLKSIIGDLIANALRREYYKSEMDEECAERASRLIIAGLGTSLIPDGLIFSRRGGAVIAKPVELHNALPDQKRAAFYSSNPLNGIREEILIELRQGKGKINDAGEIIHLKPGEKPGEFVTYYPHAVNPEVLERKVIVDEKTLSWRYADDFDSTGLNVQVRYGKKLVNLEGDYYEINQNGMGKYDVIVQKDGIKEYAPVYMEPLSRRWHLGEKNNTPVFSESQNEIILLIKHEQMAGFYYIPRGNNNQGLYGGGKIYHQEKKGDAGHYPWGRFVEMNGELVPVRNTPHRGQGVLYEVFDVRNPDNIGSPVEWDGSRWLFEQETSVHVSEDFEKQVTQDMHAKDVEVNQLSAPDNMGLRSDVNGDLYIKVKNNFLAVEKLTDSIFMLKHGDVYQPLQYINDKFFISGRRKVLFSKSDKRLLKSCELSFRVKRAPCVNSIIESRHLDHLLHNCEPAHYPVSTKIESREDALRRLRETFDENTISSSAAGPEGDLDELISAYNEKELFDAYHFSEIFSAYDYGKEGYVHINQGLLHPPADAAVKSRAEQLELSIRYISDSQAGIPEKFAEIEDMLPFYRGEVRDLTEISAFRVGDDYSTRAFFSTTAEMDVAESFLASDISTLPADKVNVIYNIKKISPYSGAQMEDVMIDGESEFVFLPNVKFEITEIQHDAESRLFQIDLAQHPVSSEEFTTRLTDLVTGPNDRAGVSASLPQR